MTFGILTLIPPIAVIAIAMATRSTTSSLIVGSLLCCILQFNTGFLHGFIDLAYSVGMTQGTVWYALFVSLFGCMLGVWSAVGATQAVSDRLGRLATTQRRTLVLTWLIGILIAIDDFTSIAVRGSMTKLYDCNKIPRAMLAYLSAATASPLCSLVPFGTWAIFYQSSFASYESVSALGEPLATYASAVPFMFYGWFSLIISLLVALGFIKPLGAMRKAYDRAAATGELYSLRSRAYNTQGEECAQVSYGEGGEFRRMLCFFAPLVAFIATVLATGDVIAACLLALAVLIALCLVFRIASWTSLMTYCMEGAKSMASLIVVVFAAYMLRDALIAIGLPEYVISVAEPIMNPTLLPATTFVACALLAFASGSNWGATLAVAAIVIPFCATIDGNLVLVMAAIVDGAAFGAHACFYCDVTVFTSGMTKIDNMEHALTQLPYCLIGAAATTVVFLGAGVVLG